MVLIRTEMPPNPPIGFAVDPAVIRFVGHDLSRPECILAQRDSSLWAADARGGVMHIRPDGSQTLVAPTGKSQSGEQAVDGDFLTLFEDGDREAAARFDAEFDSGAPVSADTISATGGKMAPMMTSVAFGGADLKTVYLGSLGTSLPFFTNPVAGLPMPIGAINDR